MQDHIFQSSISPLVTISGHRAVTTSKAVADFFGKRHDNVMRDVENLRKDLPESHLLNFEETVIERENPSGGAPIKSPAYKITRDGFSLLCMGFTGKKALAFKLAYIDAFNRMEAELRARPGPVASPAPVANEVERLRETLRLCEEGLRDCASTARIARQWLTQQTGVGLAAAPAVSALRMIQSHAEGYMLGAEMEFPRPPAAAVAPASPLGFLPPEPVSAAMPMQMELISDLAPGLAEAARVFLAAWRAGLQFGGIAGGFVAVGVVRSQQLGGFDNGQAGGDGCAIRGFGVAVVAKLGGFDHGARSGSGRAALCSCPVRVGLVSQSGYCSALAGRALG